MNSQEIHHLIKYYFTLGLQHSEILIFLLKFHDIDISIRTLKRYLQKLNLYRRKNYSSLEKVAAFVEEQIQISGQLHGYKWLHHKCLQSGLNVKQESLRLLLQIIDPVSVSARRSNKLHRRQYFNKGPNYLWHIDGYDKLKPYGVCISGCIDGFSRKIIWLKAAKTNNNPKVIAGYYIQVVRELKGCPRTIRTDMGTENVLLEDMQIYFREVSENGYSSMPAFLYGTSQMNQRIESWWSILRKHNIQFWMNLFETLKTDGLFSGTFLDKSLIQFCFMDIIQEELNSIIDEWNTHSIRKSKSSMSPSGRPVVMYSFPEIFDCDDYLVKVGNEHTTNCNEECMFLDKPCDEDINDLCEIILEEMTLERTFDPFDAINLYITLRNEILALL